MNDISDNKPSTKFTLIEAVCSFFSLLIRFLPPTSPNTLCWETGRGERITFGGIDDVVILSKVKTIGLASMIVSLSRSKGRSAMRRTHTDQHFFTVYVVFFSLRFGFRTDEQNGGRRTQRKWRQRRGNKKNAQRKY